MCDVGRTYTISYTGALTTAADLAEIVSAADAVTLVEGYTVLQSTDTDSEQLALQFIRAHTTSGSGGASNTPIPDDPGDTAFAGTVEVGNTTLATGGSPVTMHESAFNVLSGAQWPSRPKSWVLNPSQRGVLRLTNAPADSVTFRIDVYLREIGS